MPFPELVLRLPEWIDGAVGEPDRRFLTLEDRMEFVIGLSRASSHHGLGGPFAAAIFESESGRLLAPGVNLVLSAKCSVAHAEVVAIAVAQARVGHFDLGAERMPACELVTSTEPCAMCLGAVHWSGVRRLACGARDEDAAAIGFDEGPKPDDWPQHLEGRGIRVRRDVLRAEARAVLEEYAQAGGLIYNPTRGR